MSKDWKGLIDAGVHLTADLVNKQVAATSEDAAFYSWWYASHAREPTEDERVMWVCGYIRGRLVAQGAAGMVYEHD